jgi:hypothetical protein
MMLLLGTHQSPTRVLRISTRGSTSLRMLDFARFISAIEEHNNSRLWKALFHENCAEKIVPSWHGQDCALTVDKRGGIHTSRARRAIAMKAKQMIRISRYAGTTF